MTHRHLLVAAAACAALGSCAAPPRTEGPRPRHGARGPVAVLSTPPGALIVLDGRDTLGRAPGAFPVRRGRTDGQADALLFEALPADSSQCVQAELIPFNAPTPDTVRFDMRRCPPAGLDLGAIFDDSAVTVRPERVSSPPVRYPDEYRQVGIQGRVVLEVVIDTTGRVEPASVRILVSSHPEFGPVAVSMVLGSRFRPARIVGRKVRVRVRLPINFTIAREGDPRHLPRGS